MENTLQSTTTANDSATLMPKPVGQFPFLQEIHTGFIHPWNEKMAERSDLVIGVYNLQGSRNPDDADPTYDPTGMPGKQANPVSPVANPKSAADFSAALAEERKRNEQLQRELAELRAQAQRPAYVDPIPTTIAPAQAVLPAGSDLPEVLVGATVEPVEQVEPVEPVEPEAKKSTRKRTTKPAVEPAEPEETSEGKEDENTEAEKTNTVDSVLDDIFSGDDDNI